MSETEPDLLTRARGEVERRAWEAALGTFAQMARVPAEAIGDYCATLIHRGRPAAARKLLEKFGDEVERHDDWLRIATTAAPAAHPLCGCSNWAGGTKLHDHIALKEILWFEDDLYDDEWVFCLDCHQLWSGGTEQGARRPWNRAHVEKLDDESRWTCGFGANAHPGDEVFANHDAFVRWAVELEGPEYAFSLP